MKRTPLKRVSDKMKVKLRAYSKVRKEHMEANPYCHVCGAEATDIHHKNGRIGDRLTDRDNMLSICRLHHRQLHDNPAWARQMGWLK